MSAWILFAAGSALFAGVTSIFAKCGIKNTDSNVATAIRTAVVLVFAWAMVFIVGSQHDVKSIDSKTWFFLILSGLATGASWLCYFRALQIGNVNKVVPVDKSSTALTIVLALIFLGEGVTFLKILATVSIGVGTLMMIQKKEGEIEEPEGKMWLLYAALSAVFASLTAIFGKIGISGVESNLGTAIRTIVVLAMAWLVVFVTKKQHTVRDTEKREFGFICLSGITTGASWLCFYKALKDGPASAVVPIDKLSILVTIAFSYIAFKEKLTAKAAIGLVLIVAGTLALLF
ncbi:MAG: EamA family transporter [Thermoplasmatales archaeon]|nr:EamA family transporter [Thermoplasmatales archaeon]